MHQVGDVLADRYELDERIGRGGMADVYRGHDRVLGRGVAIKVIAPHLFSDEDHAIRLRREAQVAAGLNHRNIVAIHDAVGDASGRQGIVMELLPGRTLADLRAEHGRLEIEHAVELVDGVAAGLEAAHAAGLVHRDVKPGNILLGPDGEPKLTDFGIARAVDATASTVTVHGSVPYVAPEQLQGMTTDARGDLYSLGCVLFELLTGRPPFAGSTPAEVITGHVKVPAPGVRGLRPEVPPALEAVVARLLAKDPAQRYTSAAELRRELRGVLVPGATRKIAAATTEVISPARPPIGAAMLAGVRGSVGRAAAVGALVMLVILVMFAFGSSLASPAGTSTEPAAELDAVPLDTSTELLPSEEPGDLAPPPADDGGTTADAPKSNPGNGGDPPGKAKGKGKGNG
jgi:eukaryotic-like serine/threonine-protein kinase